MKNFVFLLLICAGFLTACSQEAHDVIHSHYIGNTKVILEEKRYSSAQPFLLLSVHNNERTGVETAEELSRKYEIDFLQLLNFNKRMIDFNNKNYIYSIDPNRIYSDSGIIATLAKNNYFDSSNILLVKSLGEFIISKIDTGKIIVAVHNNTEAEYDINRYLTDLKEDAEDVFVNPEMDPDDFFLTTDRKIFEELKKRSFNAILQNNVLAKDDGSMSVYFGKRGIPYVNVEAQHGNKEVQEKMLKELYDVLKGITRD